MLGIPWSCDDPGHLMDRHLTLSGAQSQGQCKNTLNNCGHVGHWSNIWLKSIMRTFWVSRGYGGSLWLWGQVPLFTPMEGAGGTSPFQSLVPAPAATWHLGGLHWVRPEAVQDLALDLAITSHLLLCVREKQTLFLSIYVNTHLQSLNIGNKRPTRGRSF